MPLRMIFERKGQPVASPSHFLGRMGRVLILWLVLTLGGLAIGMAGYMLTEGMSALDAFANAAMILSGMGPLTALNTAGGKLFAGFYALFSGLLIVIASGFVLAPVIHRVLHVFHVEEGQDND
jgi:hypothetical protein